MAERTIAIPGGPSVTVIDAPAPVTVRREADPAPGAAFKHRAAAPAPKPSKPTTSAPPAGSRAFFCSVCNVGFHDSLAFNVHRLSKKHRTAAGLPDPLTLPPPTAEELRALVERKRAERAPAPAPNPAPYTSLWPEVPPSHRGPRQEAPQADSA